MITLVSTSCMRQPVCAAALFVLACSSPRTSADSPAATEAPADSAARAGIVEAIERHYAALARRELEEATTLFTDDAVHIIVGQHRVEGRAALDSMEADTWPKIEAFDAPNTIHSVRRVGDMAFVLGSQAGTMKLKGQPVLRVNGNWMATFRHEPDGTWRIHYLVGYY